MRQWQVAAGLLSGQVKKSSRRRKLVWVRQVIRLGTEPAFREVLQGLGFSGRVNTACIERVDLTIRRGVAALARSTWATALQTPHVQAHLQWWQVYDHFVRPHASLRVALLQGREGDEKRVRHWYRQRTEADGCWENDAKMDSKGGALLPVTADTCMRGPLKPAAMAGNGAEMAGERGTQGRGGSAMKMNWPLVLQHDEKISQKWICKGLLNYPPCPKAVPIINTDPSY